MRHNTTGTPGNGRLKTTEIQRQQADEFPARTVCFSFFFWLQMAANKIIAPPMAAHIELSETLGLDV